MLSQDGQVDVEADEGHLVALGTLSFFRFDHSYVLLTYKTIDVKDTPNFSRETFISSSVSRCCVSHLVLCVWMCATCVPAFS